MLYKEEKFEETIFVKPVDSKWSCREISGTYALHQRPQYLTKYKWVIYKHLRLHRTENNN